MRQILGWLLLTSPLLFLFIFMTNDIGIKHAFIIYGITFGGIGFVLGCVLAGAKLIGD